MIKPQLKAQIAATVQKELGLNDKNVDKKTDLSNNKKASLLLQKQDPKNENRLNIKNPLDLKLKELINKILNQISPAKSANPAIMKQGLSLNIAPNFAGELKALRQEIQKDPALKDELEKINNFLKKADQLLGPKNEKISEKIKGQNIRNENFVSILKKSFEDSGVFFEARLKSLLSEQKLPPSFARLLSSIKALSSAQISKQISKLAGQGLDPKEILKALKKIILQNKNEGKELLQKSEMRELLRLGEKIESFKNYINKNPQNAQKKIEQIAKIISKELAKAGDDFLKNIQRPQNVSIEDTRVLGQTLKAFEKLSQSLEKIKNPKLKNEEKIMHQNEPTKIIDEPVENEERGGVENKMQNEPVENEAKNERIIQDEGVENEPQIMDKNKENAKINLAFKNEKMPMDEAGELSSDLNNLGRKISQSLTQLDPAAREANQNLKELKNVENKLELAFKDLAKITPQNTKEEAQNIKKDLKATLLKISTIAKNEGNETLAAHSSRLLAQLELNQIISLANNSITTFLPLEWDELADSRVIFRRGKKNKFFAQIKLNFIRLGELEILISLNNEKYIDLNIMAENPDFRRAIYENAQELKRGLNRAGLLSANFFVGDIVRSRLDTRGKNLDLELGLNKKV